MPRRGEFRATTDQMIELIDQLKTKENQKREAPFGSLEFVGLARDTAESARLVFRWAQMQYEMALSTERIAPAGDGPVRLVNVIPRPIDRILANWREAQLRLEIAHPGSPEAETAASDIERLREEYQVAYDARLAEEPPAS
jgi:hypothetical protein